MRRMENKGQPMTFFKRIFLGSIGILCCSVFLGSCTLKAPGKNQVCFESHCFEVEIVKEEEELRRGLQGRSVLAENTGMLFIFPAGGRRSFWMKETLIPLDIIWMDYRRKVVTIAHNAPPCREDPCAVYVPQGDALYVLEVNGGLARRLGIDVGDAAKFRLNNL